MPDEPNAEPEQRRRSAPVRLPSWLGGHNIPKHAEEAGLKATAVDAAAFQWRLETRESYERRAPNLVTLDELAGPTRAPRWQILRVAADQAVTPALSQVQLLAERDRILQQRPGDFTAVAAALKVVVSTVNHGVLADAAREGFESLAALTDEQTLPLFSQLAARFIRISPVLTRRLALARMLMHVEADPALLQRRPTPPSGQAAFASGWHLSSDLALTRDAYFAPLFLCASPWVWSIVCPRLPGLIVYDLGMPVVGRRGEASELLQVFFPPGRLASGGAPPISGANTGAATAWWVEKMNILLSELSDFSTYQDTNGAFVPRRQFEVFMSVEQLGRRLQGIFAHDRDVATCRALAFDAFDTLKGLAIIDLFEGCRLSRAERALTSLESALPSEISELLLIPARRAVHALHMMQAGFLSSYVNAGGIRLPDRTGNDRLWPVGDAVALYLQLLRNANHGFTPQADANERRDQVLLMTHDGNVPADLAFLPYLYWLESFAHPERFRQRLRPRMQRPA